EKAFGMVSRVYLARGDGTGGLRAVRHPATEGLEGRRSVRRVRRSGPRRAAVRRVLSVDAAREVLPALRGGAGGAGVVRGGEDAARGGSGPVQPRGEDDGARSGTAGHARCAVRAPGCARGVARGGGAVLRARIAAARIRGAAGGGAGGDAPRGFGGC